MGNGEPSWQKDAPLMLLPFCPRQIKAKSDMMHFYYQNDVQTDFKLHSLETWTFATSSSQILLIALTFCCN